MSCSMLRWLAAGMLVVPFAALAEGPYVGVEGGLFLQRDLNYDFVGLQSFFSSGYSKGFDVNAKLGYDFEGVRVEAEVGYKRASANRFGFQVDGQPLAVVRGDEVSGGASVLTGMANVYWDITQGRFQPYVGGGAGFAKVTSDKLGYSAYGANGIFLDGSGTSFAFQLMGGVKARLSPHLSANVGYRYFQVTNADIAAFNTTASTKLRGSSILLGVSYNFNVPTALTPPPPRPPVVVDLPEPAAPIMPVQTDYSLSFDAGRAKLSPEASARLDAVVAAFHGAGRASILIGSDGAQGGGTYSQALARDRAKAVRDGLVKRGIPAASISVQSLSIAADLPTAPAEEPAGRIEISFGVGSGV